MAEYALAITTEGQGVRFYGPTSTENVSYEIDFESEISPVAGAGYVLDFRAGASTDYLLINSSGKIQFSTANISGFKINGVTKTWTSSVTSFVGSGLDTIAGKTLTVIFSGATLGGSYNGSFFVGSRYSYVNTLACQISAVRVLVSGTPIANYLLNEGAGNAAADSLTTYANAVIYGYVDDAIWVLLSGGAAEEYSGSIASTVAVLSVLLASKATGSLLAVSQTPSATATGRKSAGALLAASEIVTASLAAVGQRLASIVTSSTSQTSSNGQKSALQSLLSSVLPNISLAAKTSRQGAVASSQSVLTSLIGTADDLISAYGYVVSSQVPQSLVTGFKAAVGALSIIQAPQTSANGRKDTAAPLSTSLGSATALIALAAKAGWLESIVVARTFVVGVNPSANIPKRTYSIHATLPGLHLHRRVDSALRYQRVI